MLPAELEHDDVCSLAPQYEVSAVGHGGARRPGDRVGLARTLELLVGESTVSKSVESAEPEERTLTVLDADAAEELNMTVEDGCAMVDGMPPTAEDTPSTIEVDTPFMADDDMGSIIQDDTSAIADEMSIEVKISVSDIEEGSVLME